MREPSQIAAAFPRPGRVLKAVLATVAVVAIAAAIIRHWIWGEDGGTHLIVKWALFKPNDLHNIYLQPWTLLTSGIVTLGLNKTLMSLLGLYFLTPTLEKEWGGKRLLRFLLVSVLVGNVGVILASLLPFDRTVVTNGVPQSVFHPAFVYGPFAAITAIAIAWSRQNANRQFMFMFFIPMSGRLLFWITVGFAILYVVFAEPPSEGAFALFGGIVTGMAMAGSPSPARSAWLRVKLFFLRRKGGGNLTVESITGSSERPRAKRKAGGPPLRVVQGGADDDKKPPKDKRYLN